MTRSSRHMLPMAIALALPSLAATADASDVFTPRLAYTGEASATLDGGKRSGTAYAGPRCSGGARHHWGWRPPRKPAQP